MRRVQGDRERALIGRRFDELLLATDRQAYVCNWSRAIDVRNTHIMGVATADTLSGYTPYDPAMILKLLDIHRTYYNWIQVGERGQTRAERFGLPRGGIRHQDIVYYR